jgi:hypothetical protein
LRHVLPPTETAALEKFNTLQSVYVLIDKPVRQYDEKGMMGALITQAIEKNQKRQNAIQKSTQLLNYLDVHKLAQVLQNQLEPIGINIAAYHLKNKNEDGMWMKRVGPSGVLEVSLPLMRVNSSQIQKAVKGANKEGKEAIQTSTVFKYEAHVSLASLLKTYPEGRTLDSWNSEVIFTEEKSSQVSEDEWVVQSQREILNRIAQSIRSQFHIQTLEKRRPIFKRKSKETSDDAYMAALKNDWSQAIQTWQTRLAEGVGQWTDRFNMAVGHEVLGNWALSKQQYETAREMAREDIDAAKIKWHTIFEDLSRLISLWGEKKKVESSLWFDGRLAILPFSDETNSVDGPELIRQTTEEMLRAGGYNVIPLEDVDRKLRNHGFSYGAQLHLTTPQKIAQWLDAERLVYGHLEEFREVMAGVYNKRIVAGKFSVWDQEVGKEIVVIPHKVVREDVASLNSGEIGLLFGMQVLRGAFERIVKKPLGKESLLYVRDSLQYIPLKPAK